VYETDVFISYRRTGNVPAWVHNHFRPKLEACLADELEHDVKIFMDVDIDTGTHWPSRLENVLKRTKMLVAVWSAQYFRSAWCLAEWQSMCARERLLDLHSTQCPSGLIYPVIFADSENFPLAARERQARDLKQWNVPDLVYQDTADYVEFHKQMRIVAGELAGMLRRIPPWQPGWPVERPIPTLPPPTLVPRFGVS
jgi:hypothetical protein